MLNNRDGLGCGLVVLDFDLVTFPPDIVADSLIVGLGPRTGYIEGVSYRNLDLFVLWGVVDAVFSKELELAFGVCFIHPDNACGEGHAQAFIL